MSSRGTTLLSVIITSLVIIAVCGLAIGTWQSTRLEGEVGRAAGERGAADPSEGAYGSGDEAGARSVSLGTAARLYDPPGSYLFDWEGTLEVRVDDATLYSGDDALALLSEHGEETPRNVLESGLYEERRLAVIVLTLRNVDAVADEGAFFISTFSLWSTDASLHDAGLDCVGEPWLVEGMGDSYDDTRGVFDLEAGQEHRVTIWEWVRDGTLADSIVIRPAVGGGDACTFELGLR